MQSSLRKLLELEEHPDAVQPYNYSMMNKVDAMAAKALNAAGHDRIFVNYDATALVRYRAGDMLTFETGYARKSRAPNLYELYAWGRGSMSSRMVGWFGDGNGYVGNSGLKSEVANTVSMTADLHSVEGSWQIKATPFYSYVENYIGAAKLKNFANRNGMATGFSQFQFKNQNTELYGINLSGQTDLWNSAGLGRGTLVATLSHTRGRDADSGASLYQIMPLNGSLELRENFGPWGASAQLQGVARKYEVDVARNEPQTPAYALFNLKGSYDWKHVRIDFGIDNVFDKEYALPLGGVSLGNYKATGKLGPVPGAGRSFNLGLTLSL